MPRYQMRCLHTDGRRGDLVVEAELPTLALDEARRTGRRVVMIHRVDASPRRKLLDAPNEPPPERVSVTDGFDVPKQANGRLRAAIREGRIRGERGWFRPKAASDSLIEAAMAGLTPYLYTSTLAPAPVEVARAAPPDRIDIDIEALEAGCVRAPWPEHSDEEDDPQAPSRAIRFLENAAPVALATPKELLDLDRLPWDPPILKLARLILFQAVRDDGSAVRLRIDEVKRVEYLAQNRWFEMYPPPDFLHLDLILLLGAGVGIHPEALPPQRAQVELTAGGRRWVVLAETDLSDAGESLEVRWDPA